MTILVQQLRAEIESLNEEIQRLKGLQPEVPPRPPEGEGLPRYGLRWNGPQQPLSVPMADGYWTPWHLAEQARAEIAKQAKQLTDDLQHLKAEQDAASEDLGEALILIGQALERHTLEDLNAVRRDMNEFENRYSKRPLPQIEQLEAQGAQAVDDIEHMQSVMKGADDDLDCARRLQAAGYRRAACATQPAAPIPEWSDPDEQSPIEHISEGVEILQGLMEHIEKHGNYSAESTLCFMNQGVSSIVYGRNALAASNTER